VNIGHLSDRLATPAKEQGVVLFIALIVLVVMSLIGISMIRQGSSSQMIVGNLAFKEGPKRPLISEWSARGLGLLQKRGLNLKPRTRQLSMWQMV
jgi:hypothetical protein